jgi:hypothetical protein
MQVESTKKSPATFSGTLLLEVRHSGHLSAHVGHGPPG